MKKLSALFVVILLSFAQFAQAVIGPQSIAPTPLVMGTHFVSPTGSGTACTEAFPCKIGTAINQAGPGDVVFLRGGVYDVTGEININSSGTQDNPVIYENYPGELPIFDGSSLDYTRWVDIKISGNFIHFRGMEVRNMPRRAIFILGTDNVIEGNHTHHTLLSGIQVWATPDAPGSDETKSSRNIIRHNTIHDHTGEAYAEKPFTSGGNSDGIKYEWGWDNRAEHNLSYANSDDGIDTWRSQRSYVGYNIFHSNGRGDLGEGHGLKAGGKTPSRETYAERNIMYGNKRNGLTVNGGIEVKVINNSTWGNNSSFKLDTNPIVENNVGSETKRFYTGIETNNSWQRPGTVAFKSTNPVSPDFLVPTVGGGFEDIGAYAGHNKSPDANPTKVYLVGDSTVWTSTGWGVHLQSFFQNSVVVENHAKSGRSSKLFWDEGSYTPVSNALSSGDYVLIQFGHEDKKAHAVLNTTTGTSPDYNGTLRTYLELYISDIVAKGATPILVTPVSEMRFTGGSHDRSHGDYPAAIKKIAADNGIVVLDLEELSHTTFNGLGETSTLDQYAYFSMGTERVNFPLEKSKKVTEMVVSLLNSSASNLKNSLIGGGSPLPDVVVTDITYSDGVFGATVLNQGSVDTPSDQTIIVAYYLNGEYITWGGHAGALAAGTSTNIGTKAGKEYVIPNGTYTIKARADDGNRFAESDETNNELSVIVHNGVIDTANPSVSITAPADLSTVEGASVIITANASDDAGVAGVQFKRDGVNIGAEVVAAPYSITWDSTTVTDGSYTLTAVVRDFAGNYVTSSGVGVTVDNASLSLPDLVVTSLSYADGIFTSTVKNQGNADTPAGVEFTVAYLINNINLTFGVVTNQITAGSSVTVGTDGSPYVLPVGDHTITAVVDDVDQITESNENNNELLMSLTIVGDVDAESPVVAITSHVQGATVTGDSIQIAANATDNVGVVGVQFKLDGVNLGAEITAAPYSITWDSTKNSNGTHTITAIARDLAGNTASVDLDVIVDNTSLNLPDVAITKLSYADGFFNATVENVGNASTPVDIPINVGYLVNDMFRTWGGGAENIAPGESVVIGTDGNPYSIPNGAHTITAYIDDLDRFKELDDANNTLSVLVVDGLVDTESPVVSITSPSNNTTAGGVAVEISATASDDTGVSGVQFMVDGVDIGTEVTNVPYSITWDSSSVVDGGYAITAVARDAAGNTTTSDSINISVDNTNVFLPDIAVTQLSYANGVFTGAVDNLGNADTLAGDNIIVDFYVDDVLAASGQSQSQLAVGSTVSISTSGGTPYDMQDGTHTISAIVNDAGQINESDGDNNQLSKTISVTTVNGVETVTDVTTVTITQSEYDTLLSYRNDVQNLTQIISSLNAIIDNYCTVQ